MNKTNHPKKDGTYYERNKEKILKRSRERYHENVEHERQRRHRRYITHKEEELAKQKLRTTPATRHEYWIRYSTEAKKSFLLMYGGKCVCCGESLVEFLTIEHKLGQKGIKGTLKKKSTKAYRQAIKEFRPDLYEILCMNCNHSKGQFGYCPHNSED